MRECGLELVGVSVTSVTPLPLTRRTMIPCRIHGGGFTISGGIDTAPDGLVRGSSGRVVVVSINYRLGIFGFLGGEALRRRLKALGLPESTGNFGIQDQVRATLTVGLT